MIGIRTRPDLCFERKPSKVVMGCRFCGRPYPPEVTFTLNTDHWDYTDAPWNVETLKVVRHETGAAVKAALIDESIDAVIGAGVAENRLRTSLELTNGVS